MAKGRNEGGPFAFHAPEHQALSSWFRKTRRASTFQKNGESCKKDAECRSGDCHKGDGPYKNKCKDPSHPSHYDKKPNGATCKKDDECRSGDCHKGAGEYQNKCKDPSHPSHYDKKPNGAKCEKDSQCASGDCHKGDGPFKNICKDHKSNGQSCSKDADCASGDCHKGAGDYQNKCKAPSRPAAFYAAPANFAARTSDKLQFKLDGSEGRNGKCLQYPTCYVHGGTRCEGYCGP